VEEIHMSEQVELAGVRAVASLSARATDDSTGALGLAREALLLNEDAYAVVRDSSSSLWRGFAALLWIFLIVLVSRVLALIFGLLTTPRWDILQEQFYERLTNLEFYQAQTQQSPDFANQFRWGYRGLWEGLRLLGGYPSVTGTVSLIVSMLIYLLLGWLIYGLVVHVAARWLGGQASLGQTLGALALAYAPLLLTVIVIVPGAWVAAPLIFMLILITRFQAIKTVHGLTPGYSLAALTAPYLISLVLLTGLVMFGLAYGAAQIPYLGPFFRAWSLFSLR
jgi:hypothetical protein